MLYFFTSAKSKEIAISVGVYLIPVFVFLLMRQHYAGSDTGAQTPEVLNDPFVYLPHTPAGYVQKYATVIMTFLLYLKLLVFPHPLTHDHFFNQIPIIGITDPMFILSIIVNMALLIYALMGLKRKALSSFAILYYFITFSIVSNVVFNMGILLSERFVYMPSIGFCLLIAWLLIMAAERYKFSARALTCMMTVILLLYSVKTISRNSDWSDELILLITDSRVSTNSAKVQNAVGSKLVDMTGEDLSPRRTDGSLQKIMDRLCVNEDVSSLSDAVIKKQLLDTAMAYLRRSLAIYPTYNFAWYNLGNGSYKENKDLAEAETYFQKAEDLSGGMLYDPWNNMGCFEIENNMPAQAKEHFLKAYSIKPNDAGCRSNIALAYNGMNMTDSALYWLIKTLEITPNNAEILYNIGRVYSWQKQNYEMAITYFNKAIGVNTTRPDYYAELGRAYNLAGRPDDAILMSQQCLASFPDNISVLNNLVMAYTNKRDIQKAREYQSKVDALNNKH